MARQLSPLSILLTALLLGCGGDPAPDTSVADASPDLITNTPDAAPDLAPTPKRPLGATCQEDAQCADGACQLDPLWPSGYCAAPACDAACSAAGGVCITTRDDQQVCAKFCVADQNCRIGYSCHLDRSTQDTGCIPAALAPDPPVVVVIPEGTPDGGACEADEDCTSGQCLTGERWPDGYCSTQPCGVNALCHPLPDGQPVVCAQPADLTLPTCLAICREATDCRPGYQCAGFDGVNTYCISIPQRQFAGLPFELDTYPIPIRCEPTTNNRFTITYPISAQDKAHALVAFSPGGQFVQVDEVKTPVSTFDPNLLYNFHTQLAPQWLSTLIMPGPSALKQRHASGDYEVTYRTGDANVCWYLLPHTTQGRFLDLNIYVPGEPNATSIGHVHSLVDMLDIMQAVLRRHQITLRPRLLPLPEEAHTAYTLIRSLGDLDALAAYTVRSIPEGDSVLSANIFLVKGFANADLLGISPGLPGPPGLHGTSGSAVFSLTPSAYPAYERTKLAIALLHELGHHLGLRHTSEQYAGQDPLDDTPYCSNLSQRYLPGCPDANYLMFPFILSDAQTLLSPDQILMIRSNPLVRP